MSANIKVSAADTNLVGVSGNNYLAQVGVAKSIRVYRITAYLRTGVAGTRYIWVCPNPPNASGPIEVIAISNVAGQNHIALEYVDGRLFPNGIQVACATNEPADATTLASTTALNDCILQVDYRVTS